MMLDVSKPIQNRSGFPARILAYDLRGDYPIAAAVMKGDVEVLVAVTAAGRIWPSIASEHDLVNVPETRRGWVNIFSKDPDLAYLHPTREAADLAADRMNIPRLACLEFTYKTGDGL